MFGFHDHKHYMFFIILSDLYHRLMNYRRYTVLVASFPISQGGTDKASGHLNPRRYG